jgi:hypothetical protein
MLLGLHTSTRYSSLILMKLEDSRQVFEKYSIIKFFENPSSENRVAPYGRTDMTKLTVAFRSFANAPKNACRDLISETENKNT